MPTIIIRENQCPLTFVDADDGLAGSGDAHEGDHDAEDVDATSRHVHHERVHQQGPPWSYSDLH